LWYNITTFTKKTSIEIDNKFFTFQILEDSGALKPRQSALEDIDDDDEALLAEITGETNIEGQTVGVVTGESEFVENPRAAALRRENSEERESDGKSEGERNDEESQKREEKKKRKKEKKKSIFSLIKFLRFIEKYRSRRSISRSRSKSRHRDDSERSSESRSRSRSRSRSERKKKKSKWKKQYKEKQREKERKRSKDRERERDKKETKNKESDKDKADKKKEEDANLDENSDAYWLNLRAKLGLKPM